jgi:hypothetical protein
MCKQTAEPPGGQRVAVNKQAYATAGSPEVPALSYGASDAAPPQGYRRSQCCTSPIRHGSSRISAPENVDLCDACHHAGVE